MVSSWAVVVLGSERTRSVPILAIADADNNARLLRGLEIGVNDYLLRPVDKNELLARARTQIRKRRYTDHLRDNVQNSIEIWQTFRDGYSKAVIFGEEEIDTFLTDTAAEIDALAAGS